MNTVITLLLITMCSSTIYPKVDSLDVYAQVGEENNWNIGGELFEGPDLIYSIFWDENTPFTIIQSVVESDQGETTQPELLFASALEWSTDQSWREEFAIITTAPGGYDIYYQEVSANFKTPKLTQKRFQEQPNAVQQCRGFTYFRQDRFVMIGLEYASPAWTMSITTIPKVGNSQISFMNTFITSNEVNKVITKTMQSTIDNNIKYILFGLPAYGTEKPGVTGEAMIGFYKFNEIGFQAYPYTLNQAQMRILLKKDDYEFKLIDFVVKQDLIYVLDYTLGPLVFQYNFEKNTLIFLNQLIKEEGNEYVAFDLNLFTNEYAVLTAQGKLLIRELIGRQQSDLEIKITNFDTSIKYSTNYIIISNKEQIIIYSPQRKSIVRQYPELSNYILVNPYQSDFLVFHDKIQRYSITNGILHLNSQTTPVAQTKLTLAALKQGRGIAIYVNYIIFEVDAMPQQLFKGPFDIIFELPMFNNNRVNLTQSMVGKLLNLQVQGRFNHEPNIVPDNYINPQISQGIIQDELTATIDMMCSNSIYKAVQYKKNIVQIIMCYKYTEFEDSCFNYIDTLALEVELTSENFSWISNSDIPIYSYILNNKQVTVKSIEKLKAKLIMTAEREKVLPLQIKLINNKLFILWNDKIIEVYRFNYAALLLTINEEKVKNAGYSGQWNPEHMAINQQLHPNLLFIVNYSDVDGFSILIFNYIDEIQLIKQIMINDKGTIRITISQYQFMVVQLTETTKTKISIYSLYNYEFNKLKELELLKQYTIYQPLQLEQNYDTGISFLKTYNSELKHSVILVYNPNDTAFSTPFLGIQYKGVGNYFNINNYGQSMRLFINKDEYYAVSTQLGGRMTIPKNQPLGIESNVFTNTYTQNFGQDMIFGPDQKAYIVNFLMELQVNSEIQLKLQDNRANDGLILKIPQDLISGQVLNYQSVGDKQIITNIFNPTQQISKLDYSILDMVQMPNKSFLLLTTNWELLILPKVGKEIHKVIKLGMPNAQKIAYCGGDLYIVYFANNVLQQLTCDANDCQLRKQSQLMNTTIQFLQCLENSIFVVTEDSRLQYYFLKGTEQLLDRPLWSLDYYNIGDNFDFRSLVVVPAGKYYLMLLADYNKCIVYVGMDVLDSTNELTLINWSIARIPVGIDADLSIKFMQALIIGDVDVVGADWKLNALFTTTKVNHYVMNLELNVWARRTTIDLSFRFLRYGQWSTYSAHQYGNQVLIQYQSPTNPNQFISTLYQIPNDLKSQTTFLKGGVEINSQGKLITTYDGELNTLYVLTNQDQLTTYTIEDSVEIKFKGTSTDRQFYAFNNYDKVIVTLNLLEQSVFRTYWIYIVIGIVVLLTLIGLCYCYKNHKGKHTEQLLDQVN